jgi:SAM-dependent methyltransferase
MEKEVYRVVFQLEDNYWYYVGLRNLTLNSLERIYFDKTKLKILDAGCGTGGLLKELMNYGKTCGIDLWEEAIRFCKLRGLRNVIRASVTDIPCSNGFFDIVTSLDVLYHMQVEDDVKALEELYRVLKNDGILILNLPAYNFLKSRHDKMVHTKHRYLRNEVRKKVKETGFHIVKLTYRNSLLFPIFLVIRLLERMKKRNNIRSDLIQIPRFLNTILTKILFLENKLLNKINFPFGLSVFCVAKRVKGGTKE